MLPKIGAFFVELKTINGKVSKIQEHTFDKMSKAGGTVFIAAGIEGVDKLMDYLLKFKKESDDGPG